MSWERFRRTFCETSSVDLEACGLVSGSDGQGPVAADLAVRPTRIRLAPHRPALGFLGHETEKQVDGGGALV